MNKFKEYALGECVECIIDERGKTPAKMGGNWEDQGIRVISALNVHNGSIDNEEQIRCVSKEVYRKWMPEDIKCDDCFLTSEGASLGENCIWDSDEKIVLGQRLYAIRTDPEVLDPWYFACYMQTSKFRKQIDQIATGSTVFGISQPLLLGLKLLLPNISEQRKIGAFYKALKQCIENNEEINKQLESLASTIYEYWFLQFDFPNEEGKPYKSSGGKMVWNEELKQEIPEGWPVCTVDDFGDLNNGINYDKGITGDKEYKIANIRDVSATTFFLDSTNMDDICLPSNMADKYLIRNNDILIARSGIPGSVRIVDIEDDKNIIYCGFIICLSLNDECYREYLVYKLKDYENTSATTSGGTIMQNVSQDTLRQIKFAVPDEPTNALFKQIVDPIWKLISEKEKENDMLVSLRDFLLPLLMNGQVGFKEDSE